MSQLFAFDAVMCSLEKQDFALDGQTSTDQGYRDRSDIASGVIFRLQLSHGGLSSMS